MIESEDATHSGSGPGLLAGLDIGGTKTAVLITDRTLQPLGRGVRQTATASPEALIDSICAAVAATLEEAGAENKDLVAAGAGVPGMVDAPEGVVRLAVNLNLETYPLAAALESRLGVPVALENDVRAAALGAYRWLCTWDEARSMAYLSLGTGIAAGVVLDGRLYRGSQGMAGEIGHIIFAPDGEPCRCGLRGCLETLASGPAIGRHWAGGDGSAQAVFAAAAVGDTEAQRVIDEAAAALARAVQLLVMTYDVQKVVLGGGVSAAGRGLLDPLERDLAQMRAASGLAQHMLPPSLLVAAPPAADVARWGAILLAQELSSAPDAF